VIDLRLRGGHRDEKTSAAAVTDPAELVCDRVQVPVREQIRAAVDVREGSDQERDEVAPQQLLHKRLRIIDSIEIEWTIHPGARSR
jgi:hypothetical protein